MRPVPAWAPITVGAAFALGWVLGHAGTAETHDLLRELAAGNRAAQAELRRVAQGHCATTLSADDGARLRQDVTSAVQMALGQSAHPQADDSRSSLSKAINEPTRFPENPAEASAARAEANQVIRDAIAQQRWTDADRGHLRSVMRKMTPEQRRECTDQLFQALNAHQVNLATPGPPF